MSINDELGEEYDEFRTTTGLKDDYDGTVTDAFFGKPQSGGDRLMLFMKITAEDGDEVENRYGIGNGWATYDGGKTVEHASDKYFNNRTAWAEFYTAAIKCGAKEAMGKSSANLDRRGPRDARLFVGFRFHFNVHTETMMLPQRDEAGQPVRDERGQVVTNPVDVNRVLPTSFLGLANDGPKESSKASRTSGADSRSSTNGSALAAKVKVLAKTKPFNEWVDAVMDLPGAMDDDELVAKLGDEDYYASLRG